MSTEPSTELEALKPRLIAGIEYVPFGPKIVFLLQRTTGRRIKLTSEEASIARQFDGATALSDILHRCLESSGTSRFHTVFDLLKALNQEGFLAEEVARQLRSRDDLARRPTSTERTARRLMRWGDFTVFGIPAKFSSRLAQSLARLLISPTALVVAAIAAFSGFFMWPAQGQGNILQGFVLQPDARNLYRYGSYLVSLIALYMTFSLMLSLRDLLTAYVLGACGCSAGRPRVRCTLGVVHFSVDTADIISAGRKAAVRLFLARVLVPFVAMSTLLAAGRLVPSAPIVLLCAEACFFAGLFALSPVLPSELSTLVHLLIPERSALSHSLAYLARRFVVEMVSVRKPPALNRIYFVLSILSIAWLYLTYASLWAVLDRELTVLLADLSTDIVPARMLLGAYAGLLVIPMAGILLAGAAVIASNLQSLARIPVRRLTRMAKKITRTAVVPREQIVEFLSALPLFSSLNEEEVRNACEHLTVEKFAHGRTVAAPGELRNAFHIVVHGTVAITAEDASGAERCVEILSTGDSFGGIPMSEELMRTAGARATTAATLFRMEIKAFEALVVRRSGGAARAADLIDLTGLLMKNRIFSHLAPRQVYRMALALKSQHVEADTVIFRQDDPGDRFYMIRKGSVLIQRVDNGEVSLQKVLGKGDFFGEIALVKNIPRTAAAIAESPTDLVWLKKEEFYGVVAESLQTGMAFDAVAGRRVANLGEEAARACS